MGEKVKKQWRATKGKHMKNALLEFQILNFNNKFSLSPCSTVEEDRKNKHKFRKNNGFIIACTVHKIFNYRMKMFTTSLKYYFDDFFAFSCTLFSTRESSSRYHNNAEKGFELSNTKSIVSACRSAWVRGKFWAKQDHLSSSLFPCFNFPRFYLIKSWRS